jgi:hypothetical protein
MIIGVIISSIINTNKITKQVYERHEIARSTFARSFSNEETEQYMKGIDFSKPVEIFSLKKGKRLIQFQTPNSQQGNWYALQEATPDEIGISAIGYDPVEKRLMEKEERTYEAITDVFVLLSYAKEISDNWSTPNIETQTNGSEKQFFTSCKKCFRRVK